MKSFFLICPTCFYKDEYAGLLFRQLTQSVMKKKIKINAYHAYKIMKLSFFFHAVVILQCILFCEMCIYLYDDFMLLFLANAD
jgi:hypothetical protein